MGNPLAESPSNATKPRFLGTEGPRNNREAIFQTVQSASGWYEKGKTACS